MAWDPEHYLTYADERGRPFFDLTARVDVRAPRRVVDLGCGPGNLTETLAVRWPEAVVEGFDSSPEMIAAARKLGGPVSYDVLDVEGWLATGERADVIVSNAVLQWVPGHLDLLPQLVQRLEAGGRLAFQVPGNFDEPSHTLLRSIARRAPYADQVGHVDDHRAFDAVTYLRALQEVGCAVDAWETTYLHVLHGEDPVFAWISSTGARPVLAALDDELRPRFVEEYQAALRAAYPDDGNGVVMPFRRVFVVAGPPA